MIIGYFIVKAEPAVFVLTKQVEEMTSGAIYAVHRYQNRTEEQHNAGNYEGCRT